MCTVLAGVGQGFSFTATDLGVSAWKDGQMVDAGTSESRLVQMEDGWATGTGDGMLVLPLLQELDRVGDPAAVQRLLEEHAERRRQEQHEADQTENTTILTVSPRQFGYFEVGEKPVVKGLGAFALRTPPAVSGVEKANVKKRFARELDATDPETVPAAAGRLIGHVSERSPVTAPEYSLGIVQRNGDGWALRRFNGRADHD